ncbi:uncharacterized protein BO72DRAFT_476582 [Aspergillus fijiensis CBS 313.89]|uniref:Transcription factor domain-containing protein n=1 Tax=Aspergillus fijiensis CBS 313.89 TaxID=1448319 RepID=A0A8G1RSK4_9EURO|nr:uncharacterized protein BO72DRAFT_476582 [Aspergillus fijiensis CBS 313.89]RAK78710.1 hypothetical protein BO72DRAFT_476582 [Aspergillus fijiensis CBS 313.89]
MADANFVCSYGMQVTFLSKNTYTVPAKELRTPRSTKRRFQTLRFIEEDPLALNGVDGNTVGEEEEELELDSSSSFGTRSVGSRHERAKEKQEGGDVQSGLGGEDASPLRVEGPADRVGDDRQRHEDGPLIEDEVLLGSGHGFFSDRDTSAVQGLLALGSSINATDQLALVHDISYLETPEPIAGSSPIMTATSANQADTGTLARRREDSVAVGMSQMIELGSSPSIMDDEERKLELLRHYRYFVAPWLDICDLKHPFGIIVTQMATRSKQILSTLLTLSEASILHQNHQQPNALSRGRPLLRPIHLGSGLASELTETALLSILQRLHFLVSDLSHGWSTLQNDNLCLLEPLLEHSLLLNIESSIYWMFLRLDLSVALANDTALRIPIPSGPVPNLELLSRTHDIHERVSLYARVLLWLFGKALMVCHEQHNPRNFPGCHQILDSWLQAFDELDRWYASRPQEFRPLVELEGDDNISNTGSGFPLVVFANGVGAYCNQLYHTAALLLLQCKPRTALLNPQARYLSPLWHSQRICGIALNNDCRDCWDPCLVASFLVSARTMTHESQQNAILQGFERIYSITGWHIGQYLSDLQQDWSFLDGV